MKNEDNKKEVKEKLDEIGVEEVIQAEVKPFGTSAYINIPKKHIGKKATIFIMKKK
jgi:putative transposon-encoded protein